MSPALPVLSGEDVKKALERAEFSKVSQRGSHMKFRHLDVRVVIVPLHKELAVGTLKSILRQANWDVDTLLFYLSK